MNEKFETDNGWPYSKDVQTNQRAIQIERLLTRHGIEPSAKDRSMGTLKTRLSNIHKFLSDSAFSEIAALLISKKVFDWVIPFTIFKRKFVLSITLMEPEQPEKSTNLSMRGIELPAIDTTAPCISNHKKNIELWSVVYIDGVQFGKVVEKNDNGLLKVEEFNTGKIFDFQYIEPEEK